MFSSHFCEHMSPRHVATCLQNVFVTCLRTPLEDTETRGISNQDTGLIAQDFLERHLEVHGYHQSRLDPRVETNLFIARSG